MTATDFRRGPVVAPRSVTATWASVTAAVTGPQRAVANYRQRRNALGDK
ncbi:hypothetical protein [Rhodococcus sp. 077-4]